MALKQVAWKQNHMSQKPKGMRAELNGIKTKQNGMKTKLNRMEAKISGKWSILKKQVAFFMPTLSKLFFLKHYCMISSLSNQDSNLATQLPMEDFVLLSLTN